MNKTPANNRITAETTPDKAAAAAVEKRIIAAGRPMRKRYTIKIDADVKEVIGGEDNAPKRALDI
jgi:hypothetical protein